MAAKAKMGDTVNVHYKGTFGNGDEFDSSHGRDPLKFTIGSHQVIKGFEDGVIGMGHGEKKRIEIAPEHGYGQYREDLLVKMKRENLPKDITPELGMQLMLTDPEGNHIPVAITEVNDDSVILDANHPLAGETLYFDLELVSIGEGLIIT
jgi:peptidylprolyl isomerase